jgi:hypothetical protein
MSTVPQASPRQAVASGGVGAEVWCIGRADSSGGGAPGSHPGGHRFESCSAHHDVCGGFCPLFAIGLSSRMSRFRQMTTGDRGEAG